MELTQQQKVKFVTQYVPKGESPKVYYELLKSQVMGTDKNGKPRNDEDLYYFMYVAKRTGLDPMIKQIYPVYRWDTRVGAEKMTIQVGIDGMRLVAERTGKYAGSDDAIFDAEDQTHPNKATVTVKKIMNGAVIETTASARWTEYAQTTKDGKLMGLWAKMPYLMLAKCAEALALRKAFPNELSGIYTTEEMAQSETVSSVMDTLPTPAGKEKSIKTVEKNAEVLAKATEKLKETKPAVSAKAAKVEGKAPVEEAPKEEVVKEEAPVQQELPRVTDNIDLGAIRQANKDNGNT